MLNAARTTLIVLALCTVPANAQIHISSGFESSSSWGLVLVGNPPSSDAAIAPTGGNPNGFADLRLTLNSQVSNGVGFRWLQPGFPVTVGGLSTISISADYKHFSGPAVDLLPCFIQGSSIFYPFSNVITLGTSESWTPVGTFSYPISGLSNLSGGVFNPLAPADVGFWVRLTSPTPTVLSSRVGIDNINIQIIPAPASIAVPAIALLLAHRRRRRVS